MIRIPEHTRRQLREAWARRLAGTVMTAMLLSAGNLARAANEDGNGSQVFEVAGQRYHADAYTEWLLPGALRELSGFATDATGRLFGHDDERAIIHEIDYVKGGIVRSFALGNPPLRGDFEGIAFVDDRLALTTSDGDLFLASPGAVGATVPFERIETGLGRICEIEGLEYVAADQMLWFACKQLHDRAAPAQFTLLAWSLEDRAPLPERHLRVDQKPVRSQLGKGAVRPSGLVRAPATGDWVLVSAPQQGIVTISPDGTNVAAIRLPDAQALMQIEAVAFGRDGELLIGSEGRNEGQKKQRGRMRVYRAID